MTTPPELWTPTAYTLHCEMHGLDSVANVARRRMEIVYHCLGCQALHHVITNAPKEGGISSGYCPECGAQMQAQWDREDAAEACCEDARGDGLCCTEVARDERRMEEVKS